LWNSLDDYQVLNKKLALARLQQKISHFFDDMKVTQQKDKWKQHYQLERGNPIKVFKGVNFKERK